MKVNKVIVRFVSAGDVELEYINPNDPRLLKLIRENGVTLVIETEYTSDTWQLLGELQFGKATEEAGQPTNPKEDPPPTSEIVRRLSMTVNDLAIEQKWKEKHKIVGGRTRNCLSTFNEEWEYGTHKNEDRYRSLYLWEVCSMGEERLLMKKHFGRSCLNLLRSSLSRIGLEIGMDITPHRDHLPVPPF